VNLFVRDLAGLQGRSDVRTDQRLVVGFGNGRLELVNAPDVAVRLDASRVSIELKTGRVDGAHLADAMFGALVEGLRFGRAPDRVVLWDLSSGTGIGYDVRIDDLRAATRRTIAGIRRAIRITDGRAEPELNPGAHCRFCPDIETCPSALDAYEASGGGAP